MTKKKFVIFLIFILFFIFCAMCYKFLIAGNNIDIESVTEADEYVLSIENYDLEATVTVTSNKNSNTYNLKQYKLDDYQTQEIFSTRG